MKPVPKPVSSSLTNTSTKSLDILSPICFRILPTLWEIFFTHPLKRPATITVPFSIEIQTIFIYWSTRVDNYNTPFRSPILNYFRVKTRNVSPLPNTFIIQTVGCW
ncbi:hypothetical protein [Escherichia phage BI-EHEC]|nr:hypothetical protein [Escherichia phage BI-EHEC]